MKPLARLALLCALGPIAAACLDDRPIIVGEKDGGSQTPPGAGSAGAGGGTIMTGSAGAVTTGSAGATNTGSAGATQDPTDACPCSRALGRANPPAHLLCPSGSGAKAQAMIGPQGGTLTLDTHSPEGVVLTLMVPPGALQKATLISVVELPGTTPTGYTDYSPVYSFEPTGLQLSAPAKLNLPWDVVIESGFSLSTPRELSIYESATPTDGYARLADSYANAGFSQASLSTLGYVFAAYPASVDPGFCQAGGGPVVARGCDVAPLVTTKYFCTLAGACHDAQQSATGLDMTSVGWEAKLVGTFASNGSQAAESSLCLGPTEPYLIKGSIPARGLFLEKLKANPPCGERMPNLGPNVTDDDMDCFQRWANALTAP
jgi:hypothetical protein